ncbi:uncharacterized protein [Triticum aestivum]|uniref:uncharacterized protein n=1 Tax=Triticum aestivum TaxID=4565 RepID=UPI001D02E684|nr:uncharacterized protein LOC123155042 [Triticum aestivum]
MAGDPRATQDEEAELDAAWRARQESMAALRKTMMDMFAGPAAELLRPDQHLLPELAALKKTLQDTRRDLPTPEPWWLPEHLAARETALAGQETTAALCEAVEALHGDLDADGSGDACLIERLAKAILAEYEAREADYEAQQALHQALRVFK